MCDVLIIRTYNLKEVPPLLSILGVVANRFARVPASAAPSRRWLLTRTLLLTVPGLLPLILLLPTRLFLLPLRLLFLLLLLVLLLPPRPPSPSS